MYWLAWDAGIYKTFLSILYFQVNADVHRHHNEAQQREEKSDSDQSDNTESDEWTYL